MTNQQLWNNVGAKGLLTSGVVLIVVAIVVLLGGKVVSLLAERKNGREVESVGQETAEKDVSRTTDDSDLTESGLADGILLPIEFQLPFHVSILEGVPMINRIMFCVYLLTLGPFVMVIRLFTLAMFTFVLGPSKGVTIPISLTTFAKITGENLPEDQRPVVYLTNHCFTYDLGVSAMLAKKRYGQMPRILVHPKVYNSPMIKSFLGTKRRDEVLVTKGQESYIDGFCSWARRSNESGKREALILAPAGMTTHKNYITPMHWKYFSVEDTVVVMVNVDVQNPFGINLRALTGSSVLSEALFMMMPWTTANVTFHTGAVEKQPVSSQADADELARAIYGDVHGKVFAEGWTQKRRRKIDKYLNEGCFLTPDTSNNTEDTPKELELIDVSGGMIPDSVLTRLPSKTRAITNTLEGNDKLSQIENLKNKELVLVNPLSIRDEILASVYDVCMIHENCFKLDQWDAKVCAWLQKAVNFRLLDLFGKVLHFILLEKYLILLAVLVVGSGIWSTQIFLLAQMVALSHYWLLLAKIVVRRFRPVWLPMKFNIQSGVNDIQADGSFPSGHTGFFVLITAVSFQEQDLFSYHCRVIFAVLTAVTAIERVKIGAHFASDVLFGGLEAFVFVLVFYALDWNEKLLYRVFPSDLDMQIRFTLVWAAVQAVAFVMVELLQNPVSPLIQKTAFENNVARLQVCGNHNKEDKIYEQPMGPSRDFLAPYLALSATAFWTTPLMIRQGLAPLPADTTRIARALGSLCVLGFIVLFVLPVRKLVGKVLRKHAYLRLLALVVIYMSMLVFATFYGHAFLHACAVLDI